MATRNKIPGFALADQALKGVLIVALRHYEQMRGHTVSRPHRDDHFTILVSVSGKFMLTIDFQTVTVEGPACLVIAPEQVHHMIDIIQPDGWLINIEPSVVVPGIADNLIKEITAPVMLSSTAPITQQLFTTLDGIEKLTAMATDAYVKDAMVLQVNAALSLLLAMMSDTKTDVKKKRGAILFSEFKRLLDLHFKVWKKPSEYASELAVTATHLNDTVKDLTGLTVTDHIQNRSILEAKRLLYFTDNSVGQIAFDIGYNDPVHFGKLFKTVTKLTPLAFRGKFRE